MAVWAVLFTRRGYMCLHGLFGGAIVTVGILAPAGTFG